MTAQGQHPSKNIRQGRKAMSAEPQHHLTRECSSRCSHVYSGRDMRGGAGQCADTLCSRANQRRPIVFGRPPRHYRSVPRVPYARQQTPRRVNATGGGNAVYAMITRGVSITGLIGLDQSPGFRFTQKPNYFLLRSSTSKNSTPLAITVELTRPL